MLKDLFVQLKMAGAAKYYEQLGNNVNMTQELVAKILETELNERQERAMSWRLRQARFPINKEWVEINKSLNPKIDFRTLENHLDGDFVHKKQNLCLMGVQGTGKTHSLIAIGRELCRKGITVKFYTACELVNILEEAKKDLTLTKVMKTLQKPKLLIIDELGFVPLSENGSCLLFEVFASRYERGSVAVSTNLTFEKWVQVFGSVELTAALVDRFTHNTNIINFFDGQSVRNLQARSRLKANNL